jgi:chemotaxis protein CheD
LIWIGVGEYAVVSRPETIRTVLGSCVSIGLFSVYGEWFAFNHFLNVKSGRMLSEQMLAEIQGKGCRQFRAILAGGAQQLGSRVDIGGRNIEFARGFLVDRGIPLLREDVGGSSGRTVNLSYGEQGPELVTEFHTEQSEEPPPEPKVSVSLSEILNTSREAYEFQLAITRKNESRGR